MKDLYHLTLIKRFQSLPHNSPPLGGLERHPDPQLCFLARYARHTSFKQRVSCLLCLCNKLFILYMIKPKEQKNVFLQL